MSNINETITKKIRSNKKGLSFPKDPCVFHNYNYLDVFILFSLIRALLPT